MVEGRELWTYKFIKDFGNVEDYFERIWELKKIWEFKYRPLKKSHKNKIEMIMSYGKQGLEVGKTKNDLVYSLLSNDGYMSYPVQCLLSNEYYYKCDFTKEHLDEIVNFVFEHRRLSTLLSRTNNVQEQYNNVKMIKSLAKQEGQWIIGTLETLGLNEIISGFVITKEWVEGLIEKEKKRLLIPLVEPLNLNGFKYKDYVTELVKPLDLKMEGDKMGHCVGGYSDTIVKGKSRIFHIEVDGISSTLQVNFVKQVWPKIEGDRFNGDNDEVNYLTISQHSGRYPEKKGNQTPTNKCRGIVMKLVYYLNKQELSEDKFKKLFNTNEIKSIDSQTYRFSSKSLYKNGWVNVFNDGQRLVLIGEIKKMMNIFKMLSFK